MKRGWFYYQRSTTRLFVLLDQILGSSLAGKVLGDLVASCYHKKKQEKGKGRKNVDVNAESAGKNTAGLIKSFARESHL